MNSTFSPVYGRIPIVASNCALDSFKCECSTLEHPVLGSASSSPPTELQEIPCPS